ncbi:MAG: response regulator, partial [Lachnospiraceae bacterium]|nr:response regulator [Lachnospiraceae bacterium]
DKSRVTAGAPAADKASSVSEAPSAQEESRFTKEPEPLFQEESLFPEDSLFPEAEEIPNHRKSILLVDDDKDYLMLLARWLGRDYEVDTASSGAQALRYLKDHHPDLILLDFYMPGMDGPTSLQWIRENSDNADIPVVFLSGTEDRESVSRAERLNPQGFLPKTTGKAALLKGIASFLG